MAHTKSHIAPASIHPDEFPGIFGHISNGIMIIAPDSKILYTNPAFSRITGYNAADAYNNNISMLYSGQHDALFYEEMWDQINKQGFWEGEIWNRRKTGSIYPELLTISKVRQNQEEQYLYIAIFSDITFLKKDINKKLHLAFYDALTELPNRHLYFDRVNHIMSNLKNQKNKSFAIFYMDLDNFKPINDSYGHCTGDHVLKIVGERLRTMVRAGDTIARIGGDEFTALLTSTNTKNAALSFAKRLLKKIEEPYHVDKHIIKISISIGISFYPNDSDDVTKLLSNADVAMYTAKKRGEKIVCFDAMPTTS